jgi:hypothetical protein
MKMSKTMMKEQPNEFYKAFYDNNRITLLQHESLRKHFNTMVTDVLGKDYYNMAMDVYEADRMCCEDITTKSLNEINIVNLKRAIIKLFKRS